MYLKSNHPAACDGWGTCFVFKWLVQTFAVRQTDRQTDGQTTVLASSKQGAHVHDHRLTIPQMLAMVSCCWFAVSLEPVVDGQKNVTRNQFCVYVGLWRNCLSSGQLLWLREIDSEDAVTTGYPGVPKIILIIGLQTDSDGKWTISFHEAHKCAVIIAAPSLAHSFCRKENPTSEISSIDWKHSLWEQATKVTLNKIHLEAVSHFLNSSNGLVQMVFSFFFRCQEQSWNRHQLFLRMETRNKRRAWEPAPAWVTSSCKLQRSQKGWCLPGGTVAPWW